MSVWKISINAAAAVTLESLGITLAGLEFVSHGAGKATLEIAGAFDATAPIAFGDDVKIIRNDGSDVTVFRGRARTLPRWGSGSEEGYAIDIVDAWADLEETIYEEIWRAYTDTGGGTYAEGDHPLPRLILGLDTTGAELTSAEVIAEVIGLAASVGVPIAMGSIPTGSKIVQRDMKNSFCAEIVAECLAYHPDWMTWIDYAATTPTLHFVDRAAATARAFPVDGSGDVAGFQIIRRDDLRPKRVIIKLETSGGITGAPTGRGLVVDMYPPAADPGPDPIPMQGPGVLIATVGGGTSSGGSEGTPATITTTKARIKTRAIPTSQSTAKAFLKLKYPHLAPLDDSDFTVTEWARTLVTPDGADPDPVDEEDPPPTPAGVSDVPNELIYGQITDWMQAMVGRVKITAEIEATGTASDADKLLIARPLPPVTVVATDKATGTYSRVTSINYGSPPDPPSVQLGKVLGIAEDYFLALDQDTYEGEITLAASEIPSDRVIGCVVNATGGLSEWATMRALCNRVSWDVQRASVSIGFGPPRWRSFADYVATMDALRNAAGSPADAGGRASATFTFGEDERDQGYQTPQSEYEVPDFQPGDGIIPWKLAVAGTTGSFVWSVFSAYGSVIDGINGSAIPVTGTNANVGISSTKYIVAEGTVASDLTVTTLALAAVDSADAKEVLIEGTPPAQTKVRLLIGKVTISGDTIEETQCVFTPQKLIHAALNGVVVRAFEAAPFNA